MTRSYYFAGNATVGSYVRGIMEVHDWVSTGAVDEAEVAITYFTTTQALEDEYFGTNGIVKNAAPQTLLIDLSSTTPNFARELSALAMVNDLRFVESPLLVLDTALEDAFFDASNIAAFVAGEEDDIEAATEILEPLVGNAQIVGRAGSAQLARAALTVQVAAQIVAAIEADALFRAVQNDPASEGEVEGHVGAASPHAEQVLSAVAEKRFAGTYTVEMFMGELAAAMAAADDIDLVLPQLESGMRVLELLSVIGGIDMAPAGLTLLYRSEDEVREAGLDWQRAAEYYSVDHSGAAEGDEFDDYDSYDAFDDYDSLESYDGYDDAGYGAGEGACEDHECGCGHDHGHHGHHQASNHECGCEHHHE